MSSKMGLSKAKAKAVMKILKSKFPSATRFLDALPPIALNNTLIIVPVSAPSTMVAAIGKLIAPAYSALSVSAIVTELDCIMTVKTNPKSKKTINGICEYGVKSKSCT